MTDPPDDSEPPPPPGTGTYKTSLIGLRVAGIVTSLPLLIAAIVWFATRGSREEHGGTSEPTPPALATATADRLDRREVASADGRTLAVPVPGALATILVFTSTTCPIANGFAPELQRLEAEFRPLGIPLVLVHTEPGLALGAARKHAADYGFTCPVLLDPDHALARAAGATMTPEAALLSPDGDLLYRGRIDDRFPALGQRRAEPRHTELRDALNAILANKPVAVPRTETVGCFIE